MKQRRKRCRKNAGVERFMKEQQEKPVSPSEEVAKFEGPFWSFCSSAHHAVPALQKYVRPGVHPTVADVVLNRDGEYAMQWSTILLASCTEQLSFLCAVFSPWHPKDDAGLVEALRAGIRAGLFPTLAKFATSGDDHKVAKATALALHIGYKHGMTQS